MPIRNAPIIERNAMPGMFKAPKAPAIPTPVVMPTENSTAMAKAQQDELAAASAQTGRQSTIMAFNQNKTDTLG